MKSIWRLLVWHLRELWVLIDWHLITAESGRRLLFLDGAKRARRGVLFITRQPAPYELYVVYLAHNLLTNQTKQAGTFLRPADQHVRWTYGWGQEKADALLVAEALR